MHQDTKRSRLFLSAFSFMTYHYSRHDICFIPFDVLCWQSYVFRCYRLKACIVRPLGHLSHISNTFFIKLSRPIKLFYCIDKFVSDTYLNHCTVDGHLDNVESVVVTSAVIVESNLSSEPFDFTLKEI